jgi:molecular chaperone DnaK (HSP70)
MAAVIGLDFGNFNSFTCFVQDIDLSKGRLGGQVIDLLPANVGLDGIPSVFFYHHEPKKVRGADLEPLPWVGVNATRAQAQPLENRLRYLKRHLGEPLVLGGKRVEINGKPWYHDDAIREVIQHCVRTANRVLQDNYQQTTNLIALAYPVGYSYAQRQRLIEIAESTTLEDGRKVRVFGTVAEPAAAALDYLAEYGGAEKEATVLTYDLGGGTFDLALVTAFVEGKRDAEGNLYFYDVLTLGGIEELGGKEFTDCVYNLLLQKVEAEGVNLSPRKLLSLQETAERTKRELSNAKVSYPMVMDSDDMPLNIELRQEEFEGAARTLVEQTIRETRRILEDQSLPKPAYILLTGGASQMPMIQRMLEEAFPAYRGKVKYFRPNRAIAYGAARFGCAEANREPHQVTAVGAKQQKPTPPAPSPVQQRTAYDIGIRFYDDDKDEVGHIACYIPAGTPIPYKSPWKHSRTLVDRQESSRFEVYEANKKEPVWSQIQRDYRCITHLTLHHEPPAKKGDVSLTRLLLDDKGVLTAEAKKEATGAVIRTTCQLESLFR